MSGGLIGGGRTVGVSGVCQRIWVWPAELAATSAVAARRASRAA